MLSFLFLVVVSSVAIIIVDLFSFTGYADTISELSARDASFLKDKSQLFLKLNPVEGFVPIKSRESKLNVKHLELCPFISSPFPERTFLAARRH
ncbi:hypothetical protein SASPL_150998 [Salvia splendens]|uniref:Uncharacterized protein n=1 Tax=Salvia splendens TaxID=180675 RepID=A0A8X8W737_SALSN|nr:hypothetical protein SASPL_150998 [Salvia splendens]